MTRDLESIRRALTARLTSHSEVTKVVPLSVGFSNETYFVEGPDLILRLPPAGDPLLDGHDVLQQARIYQGVAATKGGPPVPAVVHVCDDPGVIGAPFFVMERAPGSSLEENRPQPWFTEAPAAFREAICRRWIDSFGGLARLAPLAALGAPRNPQEEANGWRAVAHSAECPELVRAFDILLETPAPISGAPSIVHGDTKLANLMWRDGELTALLDWEMGYNGEPLADLGYTLYYFDSPYHAGVDAFRSEGMFDRRQVIEHWSAASGRSPSGVAWHEAAALGKLAAIMAYGYQLAITGRNDDVRFKYFKPRVEYDLGCMMTLLATDPWFSKT